MTHEQREGVDSDEMIIISPKEDGYEAHQGRRSARGNTCDEARRKLLELPPIIPIDERI